MGVRNKRLGHRCSTHVGALARVVGRQGSVCASRLRPGSCGSGLTHALFGSRGCPRATAHTPPAGPVTTDPPAGWPGPPGRCGAPGRTCPGGRGCLGRPRRWLAAPDAGPGPPATLRPGISTHAACARAGRRLEGGKAGRVRRDRGTSTQKHTVSCQCGPRSPPSNPQQPSRRGAAVAVCGGARAETRLGLGGRGRAARPPRKV